VKDSLIAPFVAAGDAQCTLGYDFVLAPKDSSSNA
jgi:hypothetical protein